MVPTLEEPDPDLVADFALMNTKPGALGRFVRLRADTNGYVDGLKDKHYSPWAKWPSVCSADHLKTHLFDRMPSEQLDSELASRWTAWAREYVEISQKSPRWRLKTLISEISEIEGHAWPDGRERRYWHWAMMPDGKEAAALCIREDLIDGYREQMRSLILECDGFLYRSYGTGDVVFASTKELPEVMR